MATYYRVPVSNRTFVSIDGDPGSGNFIAGFTRPDKAGQHVYVFNLSGVSIVFGHDVGDQAGSGVLAEGFHCPADTNYTLPDERFVVCVYDLDIERWRLCARLDGAA